MIKIEEYLSKKVDEINGKRQLYRTYFSTLTVGNPSTSSPIGQAGQVYSETKKMILLF